VVNGFVFGCGDRRLALVASTLGRRRPSTAFCVCLLADDTGAGAGLAVLDRGGGPMSGTV